MGYFHWKKLGFRHEVYINPNGILIRWRFSSKMYMWTDMRMVTVRGDDIALKFEHTTVTIPNLIGLHEAILVYV